MLDDLRDEDSGGLQDGSGGFEPEPRRLVPRGAAPSSRFMGMTARQRFIISMMLLLAVCSLGSMCLLITGKIAF
jgi:hypothetical protein